MDAWLGMPGEAGASYAQDVWLGRPGELPDPALYWREQRTEGVPALLAKGERVPRFTDVSNDDDPVLRRMRPRAGYPLAHLPLAGPPLRTDHGSRDRANRPLQADQGSDFHGVEIGKDVAFPFAFVRHADARFYLYQRATNSLVDAGEAAYRSAVLLTGKQSFFRGKLHSETKDGKWLSDRHASRIDPAKSMPAWGKNGERWMDINMTKQMLVAYEGTNPVYATLISSGRPASRIQRQQGTKRGIFRIHTKHILHDELGRGR